VAVSTSSAPVVAVVSKPPDFTRDTPLASEPDTTIRLLFWEAAAHARKRPQAAGRHEEMAGEEADL
jgi:hypothetical protein